MPDLESRPNYPMLVACRKSLYSAKGLAQQKKMMHDSQQRLQMSKNREVDSELRLEIFHRKSSTDIELRGGQPP